MKHKPGAIALVMAGNRAPIMIDLTEDTAKKLKHFREREHWVAADGLMYHDMHGLERCNYFDEQTHA